MQSQSQRLIADFYVKLVCITLKRKKEVYVCDIISNINAPIMMIKMIIAATAGTKYWSAVPSGCIVG